MAEFFRSMKILAEDTISGAPRTLMQTTAMDLAQQLNMIYDGLIDLQKTENKAVETKVGDINRMANEIAELNKAIYGFEVTGMIANDLRDKRNLLVDKMAEYIDIEYREYPDPLNHELSFFELKIGGAAGVPGMTLVNHDKAGELGTRLVDNVLNPDGLPPTHPDYEEDVFEVYWKKVIDGTAAVDDKLDFTEFTGGQLKAHIEMRDGTGDKSDSRSKGIPYYIEMLNNLARALVKEINEVHVKGWNDDPNGSQTGILFFDDLGGGVVTIHGPNDYPAASYTIGNDELKKITAKNFALSKDILDSAYNIACSSREIGRPGDPPELQGGNNVNINALYDLFRKPDIIMLGKKIGSFDDYGTVIRFDVANTMHTAESLGETSRILALAAVNQRTAVAGVSLDEEMVNLVKYQHAYNGAARVITTMDDALDRLINGTGRVGL